MSAEHHRWAQLRAQAQEYLPADFARQVVRRAQYHKRPKRREYVVIGSIPTHTQWGERDNRWMAAAALTSPVFTALSTATSSSSCNCVPCTSRRKYCEKAAPCSATPTHQAKTVFGSTPNPPATPPIPQPSASAPTSHTNRCGDTCLP